MMGILAPNQISTVRPLEGKSEYYEMKGKSDRFLHPKWAENWNGNSAWQQDAIDYVKSKGPSIYLGMTDMVLQKYSDEDIRKRLGAVYKNFRETYNKESGSAVMEEKKILSKQIARRLQRKVKVSLMRDKGGINI